MIGFALMTGSYMAITFGYLWTWRHTGPPPEWATCCYGLTDGHFEVATNGETSREGVDTHSRGIRWS